jgi:hypothetical protein
MNAIFNLTPAEITARYRVSMSELSTIAQVPPQYDCFQLKYDGWWVVVKILKNQMQIITSGADIRKTFLIENPLEVEALLIGEWMYGTNWSGKHNPGQIFIHDIIHWEFNNMLYDHQTPSEALSYFNGEREPYSKRVEALEQIANFFPKISLLLEKVYTHSIYSLADVWNDTSDFEGVVLKDSRGTGFGTTMDACKIKRTFTEDYVVMGIVEGGGRLVGKMGALEGGLYVNGKLTKICSVGGGFSDTLRAQIWNDKESLMGKVFEAYGKGKFDGGALRHPNFSHWRDDKLPTQCVRK